MPFYEYECGSCGFYTEVMQKISDAPLRKCPSCGRSTLRKLVSAPVFRLKGAGWYETDFKSEKEGKRNLAAAEKDEAVKTEAAKKEDKPAEAKTPPPAESKPTVRRKAVAVSKSRAPARHSSARGKAPGAGKTTRKRARG